MRSADTPTRALVFTNFKSNESNNRKQIQQLIAELLRIISPVGMPDIELNEKAKLYSDKIHAEISSQISLEARRALDPNKKGKRLIFIDVEKVIKMQMDIIDSLNRFMINKADNWSDIEESLINQIKSKTSYSKITLFFKHTQYDKTTTLTDVNIDAEVISIYDFLFEKPEVKIYSKPYTFLIYKGMRLDVKKKISDYGIKDFETLHLSEIPKAGPGNGIEQPTRVIEVHVKKISGEIVELHVDNHVEVKHILDLIYQSRDSSQVEATFESYSKSIYLTFLYRRLDLEKTLFESGINASCILLEVGEDFTKSPSFDWNTLQVIDPVTLEPCDEPYILDPGCTHALGKGTLKSWIDIKIAKHQEPDCPCCRQGIDKVHIAALSMWRRPRTAESQLELSGSQLARSYMN